MKFSGISASVVEYPSNEPSAMYSTLLTKSKDLIVSTLSVLV